MNRKATEIRISGTVQGVGFRPFVYRLAKQSSLAGYVTNSGDGVIIRVAGSQQHIDDLTASLQKDAPPLARIVSIGQQPSTLPEDTLTFSIIHSETDRQSTTHIAPDVATCRECLDDITDSANRRYGYPFTNCTNCGPRYTIIRSLPYDRPTTTMHPFTMCKACLAEYEDPSYRRFHAQPNACRECGPNLSWHETDGSEKKIPDPLTHAALALKDDKVIGIKGLGGFHLVVNGFSFQAVNKLRKRKKRPFKPLAVMVSSMKAARKFCEIGPVQEKQLTSIASPIVLVKKRLNSGLAENLAPNIDELGVMLPYTPLHHLLLAHEEVPECLVMTSGNAAGEPLCKDNDEAIRRLASFCDGFLMHNREIYTRVDDSVVRIIDSKPSFLRRSRGYAPAPVRLDHEIPPVLAVGAELKNSFCLARNRDAFMSQHIGDLNNLATLDFFEQTYKRFSETLEIKPQLVVADLHPDYLSSRFADQLDIPVFKVQHHWAHAASVMAEHGLSEALAIIIDGTGYGPDKTIWGGEVLQCSLYDYKRLGRLAPLPLPGGDKAARQPWRMALSALHTAGINNQSAYTTLSEIPEPDQNLILDMITKGFNSPLTSSCGRLFDAVAALLGVCQTNTFEGQAAMELETHAARSLGNQDMTSTDLFREAKSHLLYEEKKGLLEVTTEHFIQTLVNKMHSKKIPLDDLALFLHVFLVSSFGNMILYLSRQTGINTIILSGGSAQNKILVEGFFDFCSKANLKLYTNAQVPANDGGLALGQVVLGGTHVSCDTHAG